MLRKYYAEDVLVVSGLWEPPITKRDQYIQAYLLQRDRVKGVQLNRQNTFIRVVGNVAWAVYMWNFTAEVDGKAAGYRGHTTLVLEKRGGRWLIVTNHTSTAEPPGPPQQAPSPQTPAPQQKPPAQPPAGKPGR
jgi:ketosteroid isomerase-like protein